MGCQMGMEMAILLDLNWEGSNLVHNLELR